MGFKKTNKMAKETFLQLGATFVADASEKQGSKYFSLTRFFRNLLKKFHVPFYDTCCPESSVQLPLGFVEGDILFYDSTEAEWTSTGVSFVTVGVSATQTTSKTTAIAVNGTHGTLTTVALTDAADTSFNFTFTNSSITATNQLMLTPLYAGSTGDIKVSLVSQTAGSAVIKVSNIGVTVFDALAKIHFMIV